MKKQTEYTFDEAKKVAIEKVSRLAGFAENLQAQFIEEALLEWVITLRTIEAKANKATGPCFSDSEIKQVWDFGQTLIRFTPDLTFQLSQFWDLYSDVIEKLGSKKSSSGYALQGMINQLRPRIDLAENLAESIVSTHLQSQTSNVLVPTALLLINVVRTETIEFALRKQLEDAVECHGLQGKYDIEAICSVQSKVKKGNKWQTDVRAIRDATAHGQFKISSLKDNWEIKFDNDEKNYNFHKHFSQREFSKFFDLHTLLYKLQLHLLVLLELLPILTTHLHKQS